MDVVAARDTAVDHVLATMYWARCGVGINSRNPEVGVGSCYNARHESQHEGCTVPATVQALCRLQFDTRDLNPGWRFALPWARLSEPFRLQKEEAEALT